VSDLDLAVLLLVEDEALIRENLEAELAEAGFKVVCVSNGMEALAKLDADGGSFRAIVTDIRLGSGPDGWKVARRARELKHEMPIIYMSGDSAHDWPVMGVPCSIMVSKPFAPAQIVTAVATLLNKVDTL
jgi:DNA-binding response OmpR family regulator